MDALYNYELDLGKPQLVGNVTKDEITWIGEDGSFSVKVPCFERCAGAAIVLGGWGRKYFTYLGDLRFRGSWRFGVFGRA